MKQELYGRFEEYGRVRKFVEIEFAYLDAVYASPEQVYGVAVFQNERQLQDGWERASDELAVKLQSRLKGQLKPLRWDLYLILLITEEEVADVLRKKIENDRHYFRKIVLTPRDRTPEDRPYADRLPFFLDIMPTEDKFLMFGDVQFLQELEFHLSQGAVQRLGRGFFEGEIDDEALDRLLVQPHLLGGEGE